MAPHVLGGGTHALEYSERSKHRRVPGPAVRNGPTRDMRALSRDDVHVLAVGADVTGSDVAAVEGLYESAVCPEQRLGLDLVWVADDHCLAAAEVQSGERVLIRHRPRKVQD